MDAGQSGACSAAKSVVDEVSVRRARELRRKQARDMDKKEIMMLRGRIKRLERDLSGWTSWWEAWDVYASTSEQHGTIVGAQAPFTREAAFLKNTLGTPLEFTSSLELEVIPEKSPKNDSAFDDHEHSVEKWEARHELQHPFVESEAGSQRFENTDEEAKSENAEKPMVLRLEVLSCHPQVQELTSSQSPAPYDMLSLSAAERIQRVIRGWLSRHRLRILWCDTLFSTAVLPQSHWAWNHQRATRRSRPMFARDCTELQEYEPDTQETMFPPLPLLVMVRLYRSTVVCEACGNVGHERAACKKLSAAIRIRRKWLDYRCRQSCAWIPADSSGSLINDSSFQALWLQRKLFLKTEPYELTTLV